MITHSHCTWLRKVANAQKLRDTIVLAQRELANVEFDTIAFTGLSGSLFGPVLAYVMGKEIIAVRKQGEPNHSGRDAEGHAAAKRVLIVDDFVSSGNTLRNIDQAVRALTFQNAKIIGVYLYEEVTVVLEYPRRGFMTEATDQFCPTRVVWTADKEEGAE